MSPKESSQKIGLDLVCRYKTTPGKSQKCLELLTTYLDDKLHNDFPKLGAEWERVTTAYCADGPGLPENAVRIVMLQIGFVHKWMTLENLGAARYTFVTAVRILNKVVRMVPSDSGDLRRNRLVSFVCRPSDNIGRGTSWGIASVYFYCYRGYPNSDIHTAHVIEQRLNKCMEMDDPLRGADAAHSSSVLALKEACRRVDLAEENTGPIWNAIYNTSVLDRDPIQLDIDLAVFTIKRTVRWYDELLKLFKVAVDLGDVSREGKQAEADKTSTASDSDATLCDEKGTGNIRVTKVEDAGKAWDDIEKRSPQRRRWWRVMLSSVGIKVGFSKGERKPADTLATMPKRWSEINRAGAELRESVDEFGAQVSQLRRLAKLLMLWINLQTQWPEIEAMAKKPGVNMTELNKVTNVNVMELLCYNQRTMGLSRYAKCLKEADKAMMRDAISIVERTKKLVKDLEDNS
ncbi:hypothetical protein CTA2_10476 [Colletotrichum tanaceti]|uniref:Uncharacterized protein n=1 Tax=Colletotrichum tanaceti TaxID=1306861 RepID=A0A4U6XEY6_9PEZI|nr:hypothetical protein CTA2_10476 [Colletotrichum tanaceti]TKW53762.1 hypothetical protein CTA1_3352 [Colletotrichum tanaceti]